MTNLDRPGVQVPRTAPDDPRVGHLLGRAVGEGAEARVVVVGYPDDQGVRRNAGRPGAAAGPGEIRRWLYRFTPDARVFGRFVELLEHTADLGDLRPTGDLEGDQERLADVLAPHLARGAFVIVLGGGHETAFGHFLGHVRTGKKIGILNWDAHPDVRELVDGLGHSGSPFRQALLHPSGAATGYTVAGLLPQSAAAPHVAFVEQHGRCVWRDELSPGTVAALYDELAGPTMVTFDIDAVDAAHAPGVSAPSSGGMPADLWLSAARRAGRSPHVTSCDLVELNPAFDQDGQTARLAAATVFNVFRGLCERR